MIYKRNIYLSNSNLLRFVHEHSCLDRLVDHVGHKGDGGHEAQTEPEHWAREHQLEHVGHVTGHEHLGGPEMAVEGEEQEPDDDAAPDGQVTGQRPGVHLHARLEARGDHHQGVDRVPQHQVPVSPAIGPLDPNLHGDFWYPEQQCGVVDGEPDPLPELFDIEELTIL